MTKAFIERDGQRIIAMIDYDYGTGPLLAKEVHGYRAVFHTDRQTKAKTFRHWAYPLDMTVCRRFREVFDKDLTIGSQLWEWAFKQKQTEKEIQATLGFSLAELVDLPEVRAFAPNIWAAMEHKGYQTVAAKYGAIVRQFINADAPGLGKSIETFGSLIEGGIHKTNLGASLILAPRSSIHATWKREIQKWLGDSASITIIQGSSVEKKLETFLEYLDLLDDPDKRRPINFLLTTPETVRWRKAKKEKGIEEKISYEPMFYLPWDALIGDEVHKYLLRSNPRGKNPSAVGYGFKKLKTEPDAMRVALSGTPMRGNPKNIWGLLNWLRPDLYRSEWEWAKKHFETEYAHFAASKEKITDQMRKSQEHEFNREISRVMIRRVKDELRFINPNWAPPPKQYFDVWVDLDPKQQKLYDRVLADAEFEYNGQTMTLNGAFPITIRMKQLACSSARIELDKNEDKLFVPEMPSSKFDWLIEDFLPSRGINPKGENDEGQAKVVIASQFTKLLNLFHYEISKLGIYSYLLTGATSDKGRLEICDDWQDNPESQFRVLFLNTYAGGVSITLDAADDMVILDETWNPDDQEQLADRIHRTSNVHHQVNIYMLRAKGTIEQEIMDLIEGKDEKQKKVLDGARGVEWMKVKGIYRGNEKEIV